MSKTAELSEECEEKIATAPKTATALLRVRGLDTPVYDVFESDEEEEESLRQLALASQRYLAESWDNPDDAKYDAL